MLDNHEDGNPKDGQEDRPFHPDGFTFINEQFGKQIHDGDAQTIDGMKEHTEEDKDLKEPAFVQGVDEDPRLAADERGQDMQRNKDRHAQPADAMQHKGQHWALTSVSQCSCQADISFQAHLRLLILFLSGKSDMILFTAFLLKVTILMGYLFQITS